MAQGIEKDNNQMLDEIFQAIDLITQKRLDTLQFDKTITGKIINAENSDEGIYIVDDGSTQFLAYSENATYSEGTWVYVTIPNGDFSLQKNIVGKYVTDNSEYSTYIDPFSTYLDITGNLITEDSEVEHGLIANHSREIVLWHTDSYQYSAPEVTVIDNLNSDTETIASQLSSFDRIGIQADFKTLLGKYNLNTGSYGLKLVIQTTDLGSSSTSQSITEFTLNLDTDSMFGNPYNYITWSTQKVVFDISTLKNITAMKLIFFQNNDFTTDTISYEQVSIDSDEYDPGVYFTKNGDTYNLETGSWDATKTYYKANPYTYIPGYDKNTDAWNAYLKMANILTKNIYISLGYDLKNFTKDTILLYCFNGYTYSSYLTSEAREVLMNQNPSLNLNDLDTINTQLNTINKKSIYLRWVHINTEDNSVLAIDNMNDFETYEGEDDTLQAKGKIHWYRWNMTDGLEDPIAGAFWEEITNIDNLFNYDFIPDPTLAKEQIKVIIEYPSLAYSQYKFTVEEEETLRENLEEEIIDEWTSQNKTYTTEELQTEIENRLLEYKPTYANQNNLYSSDILEFTNEQEVPNSISVNLVKGLEIICDEDGLNGVYNIYTSDGQIMNLGDSSKLRILTARFNTLITGNETLDRAESITWYLPKNNTMIQPPALGYEYSDTDIYSTDNEWYIIKREGVVSSIRAPGSIVPTQLEQAFRIKSYYSQTAVNNTIRCEVYKNNYTYTAEYTMEFGSSGSNGTDYSITVTYQIQDANGQWKTATLPCLSIVNGAGSLKVVPHVFDYDHKDITAEVESNISYSWYTYNPSNKLSITDNIISASEVTSLSEIIHYILEITIGGAVPLGNNNTINLTAYCPIAVQLNNTYQGFDGDNRVTYDSSGVNPVYYKGQYCLYKKDNNTAKLVADTTTQWSVVVYGNPSNATQYYPQISTAGYLTVPGLYLSDNEPRVSLIAKVNDTIVWGQPLYISKYVYSSAFLNSWSGGLTIDEENGTIMSAMIGAGYKDDNNRFNGVLMGDVKTPVNDNTSEVDTGLYGYNEGELSFGFNIDGTAFLGKQGHGRILFDGNSGEIKSSLFDDIENPSGLRIDIDNAYMDFLGSVGKAKVHIGVQGDTEYQTDTAYFSIVDTAGTELLSFANPIEVSDREQPKVLWESGQYIQSADFDGEHGTKFDIQNGFLFTTSASIGGWNITDRGLFSDSFGEEGFEGVALYAAQEDDTEDSLRISVGHVSLIEIYKIVVKQEINVDDDNSPTSTGIYEVVTLNAATYIPNAYYYIGLYGYYVLDTSETWTSGRTYYRYIDTETTEASSDGSVVYRYSIQTVPTFDQYNSWQGKKYIDYAVDTSEGGEASFYVTKGGQLEATNAHFPIAIVDQLNSEFIEASVASIDDLTVTMLNGVEVDLQSNTIVYSCKKSGGYLRCYRRQIHYLGTPYSSASTQKMKNI